MNTYAPQTSWQDVIIIVAYIAFMIAVVWRLTRAEKD